MPNYDYKCQTCRTNESRNVKIDDRDKQVCRVCENHLERRWTFNGSVWAPTATGGGHK